MGLYPGRESTLGFLLQGDPADPQNPQPDTPRLSRDHQGSAPGPHARVHDEGPTACSGAGCSSDRQVPRDCSVRLGQQQLVAASLLFRPSSE